MMNLKNEEINAEVILLINEEGENLGETKKEEALELAKNKNLDLVQVNEKDIPVCRILDFSKHLYESKKRSKDKSKQKISEKLKEIRFKTEIADNDLNTKISHIEKFLNKGFKVQITIQVRRRNRDLAENLMNVVLDRIETKFKKLDSKQGKGNNITAIILKEN